MPVVLLRILQIQVEIHRPPPIRHQRVLGRVDRNAIQPRVKRTVAAKRSERPVGLEEGFLGDVLRLGGVVNEAAHQLQHPVLVLQHQQVERGLVAGLDPPNQFLVGVVLRHRPASSGSERRPQAARRPPPKDCSDRLAAPWKVRRTTAHFREYRDAVRELFSSRGRLRATPAPAASSRSRTASARRCPAGRSPEPAASSAAALRQSSIAATRRRQKPRVGGKLARERIRGGRPAATVHPRASTRWRSGAWTRSIPPATDPQAIAATPAAASNCGPGRDGTQQRHRAAGRYEREPCRAPFGASAADINRQGR